MAITQLIKSMGIVPEDEHYDIADEIISKCLEIVAKEGSWEAGSIAAFNRIANEFDVADADYTQFAEMESK